MLYLFLLVVGQLGQFPKQRMAKGWSLLLAPRDELWTLVQSTGICHISWWTPYNLPSSLASNNLTSASWTPMTTSSMVSTYVFVDLPYYIIKLQKALHILEVAWNNPSYKAYHHRWRNELPSILELWLLSCSQVARRFQVHDYWIHPWRLLFQLHHLWSLLDIGFRPTDTTLSNYASFVEANLANASTFVFLDGTTSIETTKIDPINSLAFSK